MNFVTRCTYFRRLCHPHVWDVALDDMLADNCELLFRRGVTRQAWRCSNFNVRVFRTECLRRCYDGSDVIQGDFQRLSPSSSAVAEFGCHFWLQGEGEGGADALPASGKS